VKALSAGVLGVLLVVPGAVTAETAYFVVAQRIPAPLPPSDAYVLPLAAPADIAAARALVSGGSSMIVIARIEEGADGINRNVNAPGMPEWSWHVAEFMRFDTATIELCDGSPTLVEQDVKGWIANTGGTICFWAYTVVAELPPPEPVQPTFWGGCKALYR